MERKYLRDAHLLKQYACNDALVMPSDDEHLGKRATQAYQHSPDVTDSLVLLLALLT